MGLDGRVEKGDTILQVNDTPLEGLSNDDAIRALKEAVKKPGSGLFKFLNFNQFFRIKTKLFRPVRLVVAKRWGASIGVNEPAPGRAEPVRPIDPGAWVAHTNALMNDGDYRRTRSPNGASSEDSGSFASPAPPEDADLSNFDEKRP